MHFYTFLTRCIYAYCSACWFRCIFIQLHFNAFARLTSSDAFRLHSPSEAHPVHAACFLTCFLVSLALSPLGFSCACLCGPRVWRSCAHSHACWGIFMHSHASWSSHEASIMLSSRHAWRIQIRQCSSFVNWNTNSCTWMHHSKNASECNALTCI